MKRMERIYQYVKEQTQGGTTADGIAEWGLTTSEISQSLMIQRTNVSKDLNELVRQGKLKKSSSRPVKYTTTRMPNGEVLSRVSQPDQNKKKVSAVPYGVVGKIEDIFKKMIGATGSMKTPVEQAKAAILYPPKGLNCLITGPTGSGKTYFAHAMYQFAVEKKIIQKDKKLIVFNCADYAHNPELLMSHLFGYVAGTFTGATTTKEGIIHEADGGILFLDEIHRLPPEGQEMIFYFMDHGTYSRLGETTKNNSADVRIICATTENPTSSLLNTFVRRIPIIIQLPHFSERPAKEQIELLRVMISIEASRIQRKICLSEDVVKALIGSVSYGNIGQLKSNVQLVMARGFLNHIDENEVSVTINELTETIKEGIVQLANNRESLAEVSRYLEPVMTIVPDSPLLEIQTDAYELPYNLYEIIGDKAARLQEEGLKKEEINHFITTDINIHLKSFYKDHGFTFDAEYKLAEIVDQKIIDITKKIQSITKKKLNYTFQSNFIYAMSLHISSFLKRIEKGKERTNQLNETIRNLVMDNPKEFELACMFKEMIEKTYQLAIPDFESYYFAVLLISLRESEEAGRIGIVVAAHGNSTATSMVEVVAHLLNVDNLRAVDMPLEMHPMEALNQMIHAVRDVNEGNGVILLVDMGSLTTFTEEIEKQTAVAVRMIDMVTTPIVLEVARKTALIDTQLDALYESLKDFQGYAVSHQKKAQPLTSLEKQQVIIVICASGEGTALKMKEMIEQAVAQKFGRDLEVVALSVIEMKTKMKELQKKYFVLATTGIVDPQINAPFIPMEHFFSSQTNPLIQGVRNRIQTSSLVAITNESKAKKTCTDYMERSFTFINPKKVIDSLWLFAEKIKEQVGLPTHYTFTIHLVMHMAGVLERILRQDLLSVEQTALKDMRQSPIYAVIINNKKEIERTFNLVLPPEEVYYIVHLVDNARNNEE